MARRGGSSRLRVRFQLTLVAGVLIIVGVMAVAIVSMILVTARRAAQEEAANRFALVSSAIRERTVSLLDPALSLATVGAFMQDADTPVAASGLDHPAGELFSNMLASQPTFYSAYVGYENGAFFQVIAARRDPSVTGAHDAPSETETIFRAITNRGETRVQHWTFLNGDEEVLDSREETAFDYDPRVRPWYDAARRADGAALSKPYVFNSLGEPGITASHALASGAGVVGVDITTTQLTSFVSEQRISENGGTALLTGELDSVALSPASERFLAETGDTGLELLAAIDSDTTASLRGNFVRSERWSATPNRELLVLTTAPLSDFMAGAEELRRRILIIAATVVFIVVPIVVLLSRGLALALNELSGDAERVGAMDFSGRLTVQTPIVEFQQLGSAFTIMKSTIAERTSELETALEKLQMLVDMAIAMSAEYDLNRLSETILSGAKRLTHADGGSLYLVNEERDHLDFMIILNDSLGMVQGGSSGVAVGMRPVPLYDEKGNENHHNVVSHTFHAERTVNLANAYEVGEYDFSGTRTFDAENNYRSRSFLTVPLKPRGGGDVMGALQLINAQDPVTGEVVPFPENLQEFVVALSSAAAVAVQNWRLMERQKRVFDDLVRFVGTAIDAKSPYTARHCARVPEISRLMAEKAEAEKTGPFAKFSFTSQQWREFEVAAWLHDCGKITTPDYVVEKATKLETVYNRIHEIRTRFEILLRDARIRYLVGLTKGADRTSTRRALREHEKQLADDFAFIARCNLGTERLTDTETERLKRLASTTWIRHFDDRLGLSRGELERHPNSGSDASEPRLPTEESLLADRREHIIPREGLTQAEADSHGFRLTVPEQLYNRGELYNLSIPRGTLTPEERFKIEEHVAQTIVLLEKIQFPEDLRRVPQYAGEHHEFLDGTGYPRGFTAEDLSTPSRIMVLSDIFEAVTSTDRPYAKQNTLSEAVDILHRMVLLGKVDRDLFRLLLSSRAYLEFARANMLPEQIDEVEVEKYL